ncbi:hypothetical protein ACNKHP_14805 [Shigella boydii]
MTQQDAPPLPPSASRLESDWRSKEEALKGMTDNPPLAGRCPIPVNWKPTYGCVMPSRPGLGF